MNITIEQLEAKHSELADLIAKFRAQPAPSRVLGFTAEISLADGEHYAGLALKIDGTPSHHLILLPGEGEDLQWSAAVEWAEKAGGALPSRQEQALLYANLKDQFKPEWYWSGEQHDGSFAWFQNFYYGSQSTSHHHKGNELRVRAVRRLAA